MIKLYWGDNMEPYKARKMPFDYTPSNEISALLFEAREIYGE